MIKLFLVIFHDQFCADCDAASKVENTADQFVQLDVHLSSHVANQGETEAIEYRGRSVARRRTESNYQWLALQDCISNFNADQKQVYETILLAR